MIQIAGGILLAFGAIIFFLSLDEIIAGFFELAKAVIALIALVLAAVWFAQYFSYLMIAVLMWFGPKYTEELLLRHSSKYQILACKSMQVVPGLDSFVVPMWIVLRSGILISWAALLGLVWELAQAL